MSSHYLWNRLKVIATRKNITVAEIARNSGVSRQSIYNLKNDISKNPSFFMIERLANTLDVSLDEFREDRNHDRHED